MSKVSSEHWQQVKEVFKGAVERSGAERIAFLDHACAGDPSLREELDSLLQSYQKAGSFMESPAVAAAAESLVGVQHQLEVGQRVNHYEIVAPIGEGGMGEVYLAKDTTLGRLVAIKLLPEYVSGDPERLRRFRQEARSASRLSHPNVCVIHEVGETDEGRPFIAMEYIEGVTLRERINNGEMKLGEVLHTAIQIAEALAAAHQSGIIHRDIKPENIIVRQDGYVKVLDFGLAKLSGTNKLDSQSTTSTLLVNSTPGMVMGTVAYMSPEQARGVVVDARTDVWSLGVVLYEMLSGHPPFSGATPTDVVVAIVEKDQPAISQYVADTPLELERIARKALRKDPDERYQIVKEMAIDLRSLQRDLRSDHSIAPALSAGSKIVQGRNGISTGHEQAVDTDQLQVSRLTMVGGPAARSRVLTTRLGLVALALVVTAGAVFAIYRFSRRSDSSSRFRPRFQRINVTKLTTNGNALFASISPDGKYVAYVKGEGGKESLWLRQVESAGNLEISPPRDGHYRGLVFSPEGAFIYYGYSTRSDNDSVDIYKVPVLGTGAPAVKVNPEAGPPRYSHDGKRIAFVHHDRTNRIDRLKIAKSDGSDEQILATRHWPDRFGWDWDAMPSWTEDDQSLDLAIVNSDASGFFVSIHEIRVADHVERTIPLSTQRFEQPDNVCLLPDSSAVIMSAKAQGASFEQIWYLGIDGSVRALTNDLSDYRAAILTADASSLVTIQMQTLANIWTAPKAETVHAAQITPGRSRYFDLCWTPDGKIVYASDASGSADIYEIASDGSSGRQLTSGVKRNYAPAVSPDNRFIVFHSNRSGIFQIWRMDRDGSNPVQLTTGNSESNWPQFSPDGKWVVYEHFESGVSGTLWKVPIEGGTPSKVTEGFGIRPVFSPDGQWLGFWQNDGLAGSHWRLGLVSLEGGKQMKTFEVAPTVQIQWDTALRWSADSRSLTFVDHRGGIDNLWAQPIDGGPAKQLTGFTDSSIFAFDWSREGNLVASRGVLTSDVVLISDASQ